MFASTSWRRRQFERGLRGAVALLGAGLQRTRARGDDGEFGHGEHTVEHDEPGDDDEVGPGKGCHAIRASTFGAEGQPNRIEERSHGRGTSARVVGWWGQTRWWARPCIHVMRGWPDRSVPAYKKDTYP